MKTVIVILSPGFDSKSIAKDFLADTVFADGLNQNAYPMRDGEFSGGLFVQIDLTDLAQLESIIAKGHPIVIQEHSIGALSKASNDLFVMDKAESEISIFTRNQQRYKRIIGSLPVEQSTNITFVNTEVGVADGYKEIFDIAYKQCDIDPDTKRPLAQEQPPVEAVKEEPKEEKIDFDNPKEDESPIKVEVSASPSIENVVYEKPLVGEKVEQPPAETVEDAVKVEEKQPEINQAPEAENHGLEFDPMETLASEKPVVKDPPRSEDVKPALDAGSFEDALSNSLAKSLDDGLVKNSEEAENKPTVYSIPEKYPDVDQTVNYDSKTLFKPSENPNSPALYDWAGNINVFNRVHSNASIKLENAIEARREPTFNTLEQSVFKYGEDQVATQAAHHRQYVEGARWAQTINSKTTAIPIIMPIKDPNYGDAKYIGPESVSMISNRMKVGTKLGVYLPHSGIYFIIVSPPDDMFLDTLAIINTYRVECLRSSSGILLGNSNFYINRQVMNLFLGNIVHCSLAGHSKEKLLELIDDRDINIMSDALGASIYPDGYEYVQTCGLVKEDKTICDEEVRKLVDLRRMVFVDNSRLSDTQKEFAAGALTQRSVEEIKKYQEASYIGYKKAYEITDGIEFVYRAQSAMTSIEAGEQWIKEISEIVDAIVTFREDENTRNQMIDERINLSRIREFGHWVHEILIDGQPLTGRTEINQLLNRLSRNKKVLEKVGETISEFQRLSSIAIVAIPRIKCECCQKTSEKDLDVSAHLIPQDMTSRLFTLVRQRQ